MEIVQITIQSITLLILVIFLRNFLPSYMNKKGENLATKEDIQEITKLTERVQNEFKREFEEFSKDKEFKYKFYLSQLQNLYAQLYAIIAQSEYSRRFIKLFSGIELDFNEIPFVEIKKTHYKQTFRIGNDAGIESSENEVKDGITAFCKEKLCDLINNKGEYASQRLLKLAVAYRFAYDNYSGKVKNGDATKIADDEEFILIKELIVCIVKDYNFLRKELRLEYIKSELESGFFEQIIL